MEISKAHWTARDNSVSLSMPISKVDKERRIVSGFASVDSVDTQKDIITSECAMNAFKAFRGNLREMHERIAAGRVINFEQRPVYDPKTEKMHYGVYVDAYVSTGAESTWQKVLDGTLTGFSVGGSIVDYENEFNKDVGDTVRVVKEMSLDELSLVDNPANQLANFVSIAKLADSGEASGIAIDVSTETVWWCGVDQFSTLTKSEEPLPCPQCGDGMENIGWIESDENKAEALKSVVNSHLEKISTKGGLNKMSTQDTESSEVNDPVDEIKEEAVIEDDVVVEDAAEEVEDASQESDELIDEASTESVESVEQDIEVVAIVEDGQDEVAEEVSKDTLPIEAFINSVQAQLNELRELVSDISKRQDHAVEEIQKSIETFTANKNEELSSGVEQISKRLAAVEKTTAVKKSGELGGTSAKQKQKGVWGGAFL